MPSPSTKPGATPEKASNGLVSNSGKSMTSVGDDNCSSADTQALSPARVRSISPSATSMEKVQSSDMPSEVSSSSTRGRRTLVEKWDIVSSLTNQLTTSILKTNADTTAKRFRAEDANGSNSKRQKMHHSSNENWSENLTRQVDRMARMSKLIMEIEYCHQELRKDIMEMNADAQQGQ